jgi:tetratricopeptide (TPR) repeat protein
MHRSAALRPLDEAAEPIRRLIEYQSPDELHDAIRAVAVAVEQSLRLALQEDAPAAPAAIDDGSHAASPEPLALGQLVHRLRARDVISLETAGSVHELAAADERARISETRPGDSDAAVRAVERLRADLGARGEAAPPDAAGGPSAPSAEASAPARATPPPVARGRGRWMAWVGAAFAAMFLIGLAWALAGGGNEDYDAGIAAFRAARWDSAAAAFERVLEDRPVDVTAMLYLSRSYRRQERMREAADVLREAARVAPDDGDVRRELGHLFMELGQPRSAIPHYERAVQRDEESVAAWGGLLQALRAAGDPRAARLLDDAPPDVQAAFHRPRP